MSLRDALRRALGRLPPAEDPWEVSDLRGKVEDLLDDLCDKSDSDEAPLAPGLWIFRQRPDRRVYGQALLDLLDEEIEKARAEVAESFLRDRDFSCACRCREHGKAGCPLCLGIEGCPVHAEADPETVSKTLLSDPLETARALRAELGELGGIEFESWDDLDEDERRAWTEACRRVVTTRIE
jgi:hypothetical protein